jgi:hypothetical protein
MKRIALLTVLLLVVGLTAGFAEDAKPTFTFTGDATLTLGYDVDLGSFGMLNETSSELKVVLVPKTTMTKGGEGVYGEIKISDFGLGINGAFEAFDNGHGDISAKIVAGPIYISVAGEPDLGFDYAANLAGDYDVNLKDGVADLSNGGFSVGYASDMFSGSASITSVGHWTDATAADNDDIDNDPSFPYNDADGDDGDVTGRVANVDNLLGFGAWLKISPVEMFSVEAKFVTYPEGVVKAFVGDEFTAFGGLATVKVAPLTFTAGFDYFMGGDLYTILVIPEGYINGDAADTILFGFETSAFDLLATLALALGDDTLTAKAYYSNLPVAGRTDSEMDASVEFVEADADKGFLPVVGATVGFTLENLTPVTDVDMGWSASLKLNATLDTVKPFVEGGYNNVGEVDLTLGVELSMIANTVITAKYAADNLVAAEDGTADGGILTLATKITY